MVPALLPFAELATWALLPHPVVVVFAPAVLGEHRALEQAICDVIHSKQCHVEERVPSPFPVCGLVCV